MKNKIVFFLLCFCFSVSIGVHAQIDYPFHGIFSQEETMKLDSAIIAGLEDFSNQKAFKKGDLGKIMQNTLSNYVEIFSDDVIKHLSKKERKLFTKTNYIIDDKKGVYLQSHPIFNYTKNGKSTIVFESDWLLKLYEHIDAGYISNVPSFNRKGFSFYYSTISQLSRDIIISEQEAYLSEENYKTYNNTESFVIKSQIYSLNFLFCFLHEFGHIVNKDFNEIECDSFAINLFDKVIKEKLKDIRQEDMPNNEFFKLFSISDLGLSNLLHFSTTLDFMEMESFSNVMVFDEHIEQLIKRKTYLYKNVLSKCTSGNTFFYKSVLLKKIEESKSHSESIRQISRTILIFEQMTSKYPDLDTISAIRIEDKQQNIGGFCVLYAVQLIKRNNISGALRFLDIGATFPENDEGTKEVCYYFKAKIYEHRLSDIGLAITNLENAKNISIAFDKEFYLSNIGYLRKK